MGIGGIDGIDVLLPSTSSRSSIVLTGWGITKDGLWRCEYGCKVHVSILL